MLKKIIVGGLFLALVGVLVAGAINRTVDKSGSISNESNRKTSSTAGLGQGKNGNSLETGVERTAELQVSKSDLQGGNRWQGQNGQDRLNSEDIGTGQAQVDEWITFTGVAAQMDESVLVVELEDGRQLTVENRPWWFAQEMGFSAAVGDEISLTGFYEGDTFEVGQLSNHNSDTTVQIRQESGRPLWAGGGSPNIQS